MMSVASATFYLMVGAVWLVGIVVCAYLMGLIEKDEEERVRKAGIGLAVLLALYMVVCVTCAVSAILGVIH